MNASEYLLPFHSTLHIEDRLSVLDKNTENDNEYWNDAVASQAELLSTLLRGALPTIDDSPYFASRTFLELLENIAYAIHGNGKCDFGSLKRFLNQNDDRPNVYASMRNIISTALWLYEPRSPTSLRYLTPTEPSCTITSTMANAILAHEALGTLSIPFGNDWGIPGFLSWYTSSPNHPDAVDGYLRSLFTHFEHLDEIESAYTFRVNHADNLPDLASCTKRPNFTLNMVDAICEPVIRGDGKLTFVLVAANKCPGPGPTGTQEERLQAASPVLTLSSLLCPAIPTDATLVTSALPVVTSWTGHNRSARLAGVYDKHERPSQRYILADAAPLDEADLDDEQTLPDLLSYNIDREVRKLYAAFSGAKLQAEDEGCPNFVVEAPPWGCGAFGGNIVVKALCMMIAAGISDVSVCLTVVRKTENTAIQTLEALQEADLTVAMTWQILVRRDVQTEQRLTEAIHRVLLR